MSNSSKTPAAPSSAQLQSEIASLETELTKLVLSGSDEDLLRARRLLALKRDQLPAVLKYEADEAERLRLERLGSPAAQAARAAAAEATIEVAYAPMLSAIESAINSIAAELRNEKTYAAALAAAQAHARKLHEAAGLPFVPSLSSTSSATDAASVIRRHIHATMKRADVSDGCELRGLRIAFLPSVQLGILGA